MIKTGTHTSTMRRHASADINPARVRGLRDTHPALEAARSIFPKSIAHPDDGERLFVSGHNNPKLGRKVTRGAFTGFPIYHLTLEERATCPRSCHLWAHCYGNAMPYARRNSVFDGDRFFVAIDHHLGRLQRAHPQGFLVRLHTLGDFFSRQYVDAWSGWLDDFPALHVFGYTRNLPDAEDPREREIGLAIFQLAAERWERFAIRQSRPAIASISTVVVDEPSADPNVIMCPAQTKASECCATCGLCWSRATRAKAIGFLKHGMVQSPDPGSPRSVRPTDPRFIGPKRKRGRPPKLPRPPDLEALAHNLGTDTAGAARALERFSIARRNPDQSKGQP